MKHHCRRSTFLRSTLRLLLVLALLQVSNVGQAASPDLKKTSSIDDLQILYTDGEFASSRTTLDQWIVTTASRPVLAKTMQSQSSEVVRQYVKDRALERFAEQNNLMVSDVSAEIVFLNENNLWLFGNVTVYPRNVDSEFFAQPYLFLAKQSKGDWIIGLEYDGKPRNLIF